MKSLGFFWAIFFLLSAVVVQLRAQQNEADRKLFQEIKAKAESGDAASMASIGGCYHYGLLGQSTNSAEAVKWYRKAADRGHAHTQWSLGQMFQMGNGVRRSTADAIKWYRKSANQDYALAQSSLGSLYYFGKRIDGSNVSTDYNEALKWCRMAAAQGDATGQWLLGDALQNGNGVPRDYSESAAWHRKAADQGYTLSQFSLGMLYAKGDGVPKDYVEAYKWWNLVAAGGNTTAKENLAKLERTMTREQIADAQRLAREYNAGASSGSGNSNFSESIARPEASGSGFFISEDGFLVTSDHVVKNSKQIRLVTSVGFISAEVVKVDAANDLALLKAEGKFTALPVATSRGVKLGGTVATVGFPNIGLQGFAPKLAKGEIASLSGARDDARYFQISVPVQPGNSGGALVDEHGNVVGVVAAKLNARAALASGGALPENVNYAVKSSFLLGFLESMPAVAAKLKEPHMKEQGFESVVKSAERAAVLVLVY